MCSSIAAERVLVPHVRAAASGGVGGGTVGVDGLDRSELVLPKCPLIVVRTCSFPQRPARQGAKRVPTQRVLVVPHGSGSLLSVPVGRISA